ncbi:cytochrome-c oxidase [Ectobacillus funiculus]|uniref:cytochrome-c oxidase n=1 Tax=Ectobacillus funiculus TaxID=137993 RepID=UPI0039790C34
MGVIMLRISAVYFLIGTLMGVMIHALPMLRVVHPHWNLLGWVSFSIAGLVYTVFPAAGKSKLGIFHFWLTVIGMPLLFIGLFLSGIGLPAEPYAPIGGLLIIIGALLFTINVFKHVKLAGFYPSHHESFQNHIQK